MRKHFLNISENCRELVSYIHVNMGKSRLLHKGLWFQNSVGGTFIGMIVSRLNDYNDLGIV